MKGKIALSVCIAIAACSFGDVDLEGRPCPCLAPRYACNEATHRCVLAAGPLADGGASGFSLLPIAETRIGLGQTGIVHVQIARDPSFHDPVSITSLDAPPFLTLSPGTIPPDGTGVDIQASVNAGATAGAPATVRLLASAGNQGAETTASILVIGTSGAVDTTFGDRGAVKLDTFVTRLFEFPDGRILCGSGVHSPSVYRLNADGSKDATFGVAGKATTSFGSNSLGHSIAMDLMVQRDGKSVVLGQWIAIYTSSPPAATRLDANGTGDSTFGKKGIWMHSTDGVPGAFAVTDDDSILGTTGGANGIMVFKLAPGGAFDTSFGASGTVVALAGSTAQPHAMVLESGNKILIAGGIFGASGGAFMRRYLSTGALDTGFASGGALLDATLSQFDALGLQKSGQILALSRMPGSARLVALQRYDASGNRDAMFGSITVPGLSTYAAVGAVVPDDSFFVGGMDCPVGAATCVPRLFRFSSNGVPDAQFGTNGAVTLPFDWTLSAMLITRDGRMLVSFNGPQDGTGSIVTRLWL